MLVRRQLEFASLDEAVRDAEHLRSQGYERVGNWDLATCCHHLAVLMDYPIDGFPKFSFPLNIACWILKNTIAPSRLRKILDSGVWPEGTPTDKRTVLTLAVGNEEVAVLRLRESAERLLSYDGPLQSSPLFGMLDKESLLKLHRIHTAHHLSFLIPNEANDPVAIQNVPPGQNLD